MFSTLSSYIWSNEQEDQTVPNREIETKEEQAENEWVLVNVVPNVDSLEKSDEIDACKRGENGGAQAVPELPANPEESWYITPPSCFNAGQAESYTLETGPLENLLIEHPSMSVYGAPEPLLDEYDFELEATENPPASTERVIEQTPAPDAHRRVHRVVDKVELLTRRVQKNVVEQAKRTLRKTRIERANKTHERTSHSKRKRKQIDRKQGKHSGVYSNRGC